MKGKPGTKHITKIEGGYWVRFASGATKSTQPEVISGTFYVSRYGGAREALAAAKEWRDEMLAVLNPGGRELPRGGDWLKGKHYETPKVNNRYSGVAGVCLTYGYDRNGTIYWKWQTTWTEYEDGKIVKRSKAFRFKHRGSLRDHEQYQSAVDHRMKMVAEHSEEVVS